MKDSNRIWWALQGIPNEWQDFWKLGYCLDKIIQVGREYMYRAAYTIPKFKIGWEFVNMDYRLVDPPDRKNRYRHHHNGVLSTWSSTCAPRPASAASLAARSTTIHSLG